MSVWSTKSLNRERNYIVLQHLLKGVNYSVMGIKFRDGYAVVEKDSKTYFALKKMPILKNATEHPLIHLRKLRFITRAIDVKIVYGQDVYRYYTKVLQQELNKEQSEETNRLELEHLDNGGCSFRTIQTNILCQHVALENSPSQYCRFHILEDPRLAELNIKVPKFIARDEKEKLKEKVLRQLDKVKVEKTDGENNREEQEVE